MKICVLALEGLTLEAVLADERLVNLRRLMDLGVYGKLTWGTRENVASLDASVIANHLASQGKKSILAGVPQEGKPGCAEISDIRWVAKQSDPGKQWQLVRSLVREGDWEYLYLAARESDRQVGPEGVESDEKAGEFAAQRCLCLDVQIGLLLEELDDRTILLLVTHERPPLEGMFILTAPGILAGECKDVHPSDLAPTLLELAGYVVPATMQGQSVVAHLRRGSATTTSEAEQKLLQDRLSGLGYI